MGLWESEEGWRVGKELEGMEGCAGGEGGDVKKAGLGSGIE